MLQAICNMLVPFCSPVASFGSSYLNLACQLQHLGAGTFHFACQLQHLGAGTFDFACYLQVVVDCWLLSGSCGFWFVLLFLLQL